MCAYSNSRAVHLTTVVDMEDRRMRLSDIGRKFYIILRIRLTFIVMMIPWCYTFLVMVLSVHRFTHTCGGRYAVGMPWRSSLSATSQDCGLTVVNIGRKFCIRAFEA